METGLPHPLIKVAMDRLRPATLIRRFHLVLEHVMAMQRTLIWLGAACAALAYTAQAEATARIGGVVSMNAGTGACRNDQLVDSNTAQDTFHLYGATSCLGGSASAELRADAATGSIGLRAASAGSGQGSSQVATQLQFSDQWSIAVPAGTPFGTITLPVTVLLEGNVTPGALYDPSSGSFMAYSMAIGPLFSFADFNPNGNIKTSGHYASTFNGSVSLTYTGQPLKAAVSMSLLVPALVEGTLDFYNTASISLLLPPGYSATTSSGLPLVFAAAVPEPASAALLAFGLGLLLMARRRKVR